MTASGARTPTVVLIIDDDTNELLKAVAATQRRTRRAQAHVIFEAAVRREAARQGVRLEDSPQ